MYVVITENDISNWDDRTGDKYHFPSRYLKYLKPGTRVVYYKGKMRDRTFGNRRLTPEPHYFGIATIGTVTLDPASNKGDWYADIVDFARFSKPVLLRYNGETLEEIPESKQNNYWRNGVRQISESIYKRILNLSDLSEENLEHQLTDQYQGNDDAFTSFEGERREKITTVYERDPKLREQAIRIHGLTCMACGFNFEDVYGDWGAGFIHVHHTKPVSESGQREVNAREDLIVLCANCHSMVHRKRSQVLSLEELREKMKRTTLK